MKSLLDELKGINQVIKLSNDSIGNEIHIKIITDAEELKKMNYDNPVIMLYNQFSCNVIDSKSISFKTIQRELQFIEMASDNFSRFFKSDKK